VSAGNVADGEDVAHLEDLYLLHAELQFLCELCVSGNASGHVYTDNA
jgi:hypothetical protein